MGIIYQALKHVFNAPLTTNESFRSEWITKQLHKIWGAETILDAGAGECRYKKDCQHLKYTSQDFCQYTGQEIEKGIGPDKWDVSHIDIVSDITKIPVEDASYDHVLCTEVFEHIPHPDLAMKEFSRILKPGGTLIITFPYGTVVHFAPYFFSSGYSEFMFEEWCRMYGLRVLEKTYNGNYFSVLQQEMERLPGVADTYGVHMGTWDKFLARLLRRKLRNMSMISKGSETLHCFGLFFVAEKM